jgi:hypothetical protein
MFISNKKEKKSSYRNDGDTPIKKRKPIFGTLSEG